MLRGRARARRGHGGYLGVQGKIWKERPRLRVMSFMTTKAMICRSRHSDVKHLDSRTLWWVFVYDRHLIQPR